MSTRSSVDVSEASTQEKNRLLDDGEEGSTTALEVSHCSCCRSSSLLSAQKSLNFIVTFLLVGLMIVLLIVAMLLRPEPTDPSLLIYSPGNDLVQYETRRFYRSRGDDQSPYQGWPSDEKDQLWKNAYLTGLFTYVDSDTASKLPNETQRVAEEGYEDQYMVVLDVFHQLHCLDFIRRAFYPERYGKGMYHPNGTLHHCNWVHIDHCIDQVRQSIMCSADVSPVSVQWNDGTKSMRPRVDGMHTCRNYDKLMDWVLQRNMSVFHGASHVVEQNGQLVIEDYLEDKWSGKIEVEPSECHAL